MSPQRDRDGLFSFTTIAKCTTETPKKTLVLNPSTGGAMLEQSFTIIAHMCARDVQHNRGAGKIGAMRSLHDPMCMCSGPDRQLGG